MRTAINTRLVFEIPAKRRPGKQERRGVWLASRVVAAFRLSSFRRSRFRQLGDVGGDAPRYRAFAFAIARSSCPSLIGLIVPIFHPSVMTNFHVQQLRSSQHVAIAWINEINSSRSTTPAAIQVE